MSEQSKAMELANQYESERLWDDVICSEWINSAASELRRLDAENAALRAQLANGEPVAWIAQKSLTFLHSEFGKGLRHHQAVLRLTKEGNCNVPLYTAPQQAPATSRLEAAKAIAESPEFKQTIGESIAAMPQTQLPNGAYAGAPVDEREAFEAWWLKDTLCYDNPFESGSPKFWTYEGWQAALKPAVPNEMSSDDAPLGLSHSEASSYASGWNACREAMLAAAKE